MKELELDDEGMYPTEESLKAIEDWDVIGDGIGMFDAIARIWQYGSWGWREREDRDGSRHYEVSTGGWSGNEEILQALEKNFAMSFFMESHKRGGHYHFVIPPSFQRKESGPECPA